MAPHAGEHAPAPAAGPGRVTLAAVTGAHGVSGDVRLKLFTEDLARYATLEAGDATLTLLAVRGGGTNGAVARFAEVTDRTAAEALRGTLLTVARDRLPPLGDGEYYHADLIGLPVRDSSGCAIGRVVEIENFGAGDVIEIERDAPGGGRFMVPMRPEAVPEWSASGLVVDAAFVP